MGFCSADLCLTGFSFYIGTASGSNSPTSDSASVQRADAPLNNCEGAAGSTSEKSR